MYALFRYVTAMAYGTNIQCYPEVYASVPSQH
jgi:hypothetical protein